MFIIYNVEFNSQREMFLALGYSRPISKSMIDKQYGGIEKLIANKVSAGSPEEMTEKLTTIRDAYRERINREKELQNINEEIKEEVYPINYYVLMALKLGWKRLSESQREDIIKGIALISNVDEKALTLAMSENTQVTL